MTNTIFETTQETKYDTWEPDALKKKALAADTHIITLETELAELRNSKETEARLEAVLAKLDQLNTPHTNQTSNVVNHATENRVSTSQITPEQIERLLDSRLELKTKEAQTKANVEKVRKELIAAYGDNFQTTLNNKMTELGVSQEFLASMAETHPDAFIKLLVDKRSKGNINAHVPPTSIQNTNLNMASLQGETWKDFSKAMKDNPSLRTDPQFVRRMHETAERLGASFYN